MIFRYSMPEVVSNHLMKAAFLLFIFTNLSQISFSQDSGNTGDDLNLSGFFSITTNNGIAAVPALSLGEPAAILGLSAGNRFRFEPEFKFSLKGIPWAFNFWWRYDVIKKDQFEVTAGIPVFIWHLLSV